MNLAQFEAGGFAEVELPVAVGVELASGREAWTTSQLQAEFEVQGFSMGFVVVKRKSDGQIGSMQFTGSPRWYYGWQEHHDGS